MLNTSSKVSPAELYAFVTALSAHINARGRAQYPACDLNWDIITTMPGRKFVRLVREAELYPGSSRSAFGFIDMSNGDILKADGWKKPAKHARGNIRVGDVSNGWNGAIQNGFISYLR